MRVMLIEDDPLMRGLIADALGDEGMEVDGLANAEDALIPLGAGRVPDVLVADVNLGPGLSGRDLAQIARDRHPGVEVVLISGRHPPPCIRFGASASCASRSRLRPWRRRYADARPYRAGVAPPGAAGWPGGVPQGARAARPLSRPR